MQSFLGHAGQTCPMMEEFEKESIKKMSPERIYTKNEWIVRPWENPVNYKMKRAKQLWIMQFHCRISFKVQVVFSEPN